MESHGLYRTQDFLLTAEIQREAARPLDELKVDARIAEWVRDALAAALLNANDRVDILRRALMLKEKMN